MSGVIYLKLKLSFVRESKRGIVWESEAEERDRGSTIDTKNEKDLPSEVTPDEKGSSQPVPRRRTRTVRVQEFFFTRDRTARDFNTF